MRKKIFITLLFVFFCCHAIGCRAGDKNRVCFKDRCINVEVVSTKEEMMRGLQFRRSLGHNNGMLFVFSYSDRHSFWMKDTLIPLDMIWLDYAQRVVHIEKDVKPCKTPECPSYTPSQGSLYVLELNAGMSDEVGIKLGDRLDFFIIEK